MISDFPQGTPFGVTLRSLRRAARLTLEELAGLSGVSVRALGDMERGRSRGPQRRTVEALADALKLDAEERGRLRRLADAGRDRGGDPPAPYLLRTVPDFTGREDELAALAALAADPARTRGVVLFGPGGQGKTTLAAEAARRLADHFPDGCVTVQLHGMSESPVPAAEALVLLLTALGHPPDRIPADPTTREAVYRATLAARRVLVVLDDAADEADTRPLLPDAPGCFALVTGRRPLAGLEGVQRIRLGGLSTRESATLLERILGTGRTAGQTEAIERLTGLCGHLPLALRIVGNRLSSRPTWTPDRLAGQLADEERRLSGLVAGDLAVRSAFALSYRQLTGPRRLLLRRLALTLGRDTGPELAAVLVEGDPIAVEDSLDQLVDRGLLEETAHGRYALHDLVCLFAREQLVQEDPPEVTEAARLRMADWLLRSASAAGRLFEAPGAPQPWPGDIPAFTPASREDAEEWLITERAHWAGALDVLAEAGAHEHILHTSRTLYWFSDRWSEWPEWRLLFGHGARSAAALGDRAAEAHQLHCLAWAHSVGAAQYAQAEEHARRSLELATEAGDRDRQAWAWAHLSGALLGQDRPAEGLRAIEQALELFEVLDDPMGRAVAARQHASALRAAGQPERALALHRAQLGVSSGDVPDVGEYIQALLHLDIAADLLALGRWEEAAAAYRAVMAPATHEGIERFRGNILAGLATALEHMGDVTEALEHYEDARRLYESAEDTASAARTSAAIARLSSAD
ncbi:XRE family transcriptional regulator [Streptomyces sp. S.PB5]|uniref:XRE family transcriptional regulator n=1 Tax=Streptomyces sp. S.PB5 TaxID=3020844 RepID=UPI0025B17C90|nr:XRE family transcriptional regulator [Streptomyces sp. S.PB5]MDN3020544.1 helix-turn-helix domain-containing protein [Streptomyces sp. S.PB5]